MLREQSVRLRCALLNAFSALGEEGNFLFFLIAASLTSNQTGYYIKTSQCATDALRWKTES